MVKPPNMKHQAKPNHMNTTVVAKKPVNNKVNPTVTTSGTTTSRKPSSKLPEFVCRRVEKPIIDDSFRTELNITVAEAQEGSTHNQEQSPKQEPKYSTSSVSASSIKGNEITLPPYIPCIPPHQIIPDWFGYNSPERLASIESRPVIKKKKHVSRTDKNSELQRKGATERHTKRERNGTQYTYVYTEEPIF